jgi:hypothetical protein
MFFLLLGGGEYFYANTSPNKNLKTTFQKLTKDKESEHILDDQSTTLIEDTDVDAELEFIDSEDDKGNLVNKFISSKYNLLNTLYSSNFRQLLLNYYCNRFKIAPFSGTSTSPIYITLRVLRI